MNKRAVIGMVVSVIIIIAMIYLVNPRELIEAFSNSNLYYVLLVIVLYLINLIIKAFRWYLIVRASARKTPFVKILPFYIIALTLNNITPGKVGGEPVRVYLLKKESDVSFGQGVASIFAEKVIDITVVTAIAVIGAIMILPLLAPSEVKTLIGVLALVIALIVVGLFIVTHSTIFQKTIDKSVSLATKISKGSFMTKVTLALKGFVERFKFGMNKLAKEKKIAASAIALSVFIWLNEALRLYIILLALPGIEGVSIGAVLIASSISIIIGIALPLGAGNLLAIGAVFVAVGMDSSTAGIASFAQVATSVWISVPLCVMAMLITGFRVSKAAERE